jgi:hypothetical protein
MDASGTIDQEQALRPIRDGGAEGVQRDRKTLGVVGCAPCGERFRPQFIDWNARALGLSSLARSGMCDPGRPVEQSGRDHCVGDVGSAFGPERLFDSAVMSPFH